MKTSSRIDPLDIRVNSGYFTARMEAAGRWTRKWRRPKRGNRPDSGRTATVHGKPRQCPTIRFQRWRHHRLRRADDSAVFTGTSAAQVSGESGAASRPADDVAERTYLAALAVLGATLAVETGYDLRSRCLLRAVATARWTLLRRPGEPDPTFAIRLYKDRSRLSPCAGSRRGMVQRRYIHECTPIARPVRRCSGGQGYGHFGQLSTRRNGKELREGH